MAVTFHSLIMVVTKCLTATLHDLSFQWHYRWRPHPLQYVSQEILPAQLSLSLSDHLKGQALEHSKKALQRQRLRGEHNFEFLSLSYPKLRDIDATINWKWVIVGLFIFKVCPYHTYVHTSLWSVRMFCPHALFAEGMEKESASLVIRDGNILNCPSAHGHYELHLSIPLKCSPET